MLLQSPVKPALSFLCSPVLYHLKAKPYHHQDLNGYRIPQLPYSIYYYFIVYHCAFRFDPHQNHDLHLQDLVLVVMKL